MTKTVNVKMMIEQRKSANRANKLNQMHTARTLLQAKQPKS